VNEAASLTRRLARALMACTAQLLPSTRLDWAKAMRAEFDRLGKDRDALVWAAGCIAAALKERVSAMLTGNVKISRWVLIPEMLLCFVPLTLAWWDAIGGDSGIIRLNGEVIQKYFINVHGGTFALATMMGGAVLGVLGPVGLIAAFRWIVLERQTRNGWIRGALLFGPLAYGVLTLATRVAIGGADSLRFDAIDSFDFWSGILLLSALPGLGAAHLLTVSSKWPRSTAPALSQ
jgi:hypothetical protein